MDIKSPE